MADLISKLDRETAAKICGLSLAEVNEAIDELVREGFLIPLSPDKDGREKWLIGPVQWS